MIPEIQLQILQFPGQIFIHEMTDRSIHQPVKLPLKGPVGLQDWHRISQAALGSPAWLILIIVVL